MPDYVSIAERALKAVRYGFFCVNDQIALALDGLCRIPEPPRVDYQDGTEKLDPDYEYDYCGASSPYTDVTCIKPAGHEGQHKCFDKLWNVWDTSSPAVEFPPAAVADSTPEAAVSRPSAKSALTTPAEGHPIPIERDPMYLALRIAEVAEGVPFTTLLTIAQMLINRGGQAVVIPDVEAEK